MATLHFENVPEAVYKALRERARHNRRSIAAEAIELPWNRTFPQPRNHGAAASSLEG
jgi:plasmid stability protein